MSDRKLYTFCIERITNWNIPDKRKTPKQTHGLKTEKSNAKKKAISPLPDDSLIHYNS